MPVFRHVATLATCACVALTLGAASPIFAATTGATAPHNAAQLSGHRHGWHGHHRHRGHDRDHRRDADDLRTAPAAPKAPSAPQVPASAAPATSGAASAVVQAGTSGAQTSASSAHAVSTAPVPAKRATAVPSASTSGTPTVGDPMGGRTVVRILHLTATAYGPSLQDNFPYGPTDAFGKPLVPGDVAVDPSVIPLNTHLYVAGYKSASLPKGGEMAVARDTGGAIHGARIDIFIDGTAQQVAAFGVQPVTVYVLK